MVVVCVRERGGNTGRRERTGGPEANSSCGGSVWPLLWWYRVGSRPRQHKSLGCGTRGQGLLLNLQVALYLGADYPLVVPDHLLTAGTVDTTGLQASMGERLSHKAQQPGALGELSS